MRKVIRGATPLHYAVFSDSNIDVLKYLIDKGVNVNVKNDDGETPLDYVTDNKKKEAILREVGGKRGKDLPE